MPEETPSFFSQPLPEETVKPKRRTATRKHTTTHPQRKPKNKATPTIDTKKISRQLDSIYRDENGRIPDMSRIKIKKESSFLKKFFIFIIIISFLAAAAWAGFFLMPNKNFSDNQVNIVINGPDNIIFGATSTYEVIISNNQSVEIKNVNLNLRYPESFVFISSSLPATNKGNTEWNLNDISGNKEQKIQISGVYYGVLEQDQSWRASVRYQPENFNSELQRSAVKTVKITHSPYSLTITGPDKAAVGSEVEYLITLEDREGKPNQKFIIRNTFPNNFYITTSSPILEKDNNWIFVYSPIINTSTTSTTNTANLVLPLRQIFSVKGKFVDSEQNKTTLRSELLFVSNQDNYQIDESTITTELVRNSVSLEMAINGSTENITTRPGEQLNITIAAKNDSKDKLSKASINIYFDAPAYKRQSVIDWAKITDKSDGDVVGKQISDTIRQAKITWNGSKLNTLNNWKPNQEVQFNFQVPKKLNCTS